MRPLLYLASPLRLNVRCLSASARACGQNVVEKIAQRYAEDIPAGHVVRAGDFVSVRPAFVMTHDNTAAVMSKFAALGGTRIADPRQLVFTLDHNVQDTSEKNVAKYAAIAAFAARHGVDAYRAGRGIGHQVMVEEGYVLPGTLVVASDSHSNMYGGLGCLGTPVVRTDAASIWATGRTWWQVPPVARVTLTGALRPGVTGKDVIITLCGLFGKDEVLNHALEFAGDGIAGLSVDSRLTIANMTTEWGALAAVFPVDGVTLAWLRQRAAFLASRANPPPRAEVPSYARGPNPRLTEAAIRAIEEAPVRADPDAFYSAELSLDLSSVRPHVSGPNHVKVMRSVADIEAERVAIQKAYIVSCVNSRVDDLAEAAAVVRGRKIHPSVRLYVAAASSEVEAASRVRGDWDALLDAGATPLPPGCGPCVGLGAGLLEEGETGISATNRNFKGRMGARTAKAYLASPAVVAASALAGHICGPAPSDATPPRGTHAVNTLPDAAPQPVAIVDGFPRVVSGALVFCHQDGLNTDGIYAGAYTYREDVTPAMQAEVVMQNYDPQFVRIAAAGDVLVGGFNFGTGSSREQAATALLHKGIRVVIAGSFSETYKRNAFNNGLIAIEAPALVRDVTARFGRAQPTVRPGDDVHIDFGAGVVSYGGRKYSFSPLGRTAQDLIVAGGLEPWIKARM